MLSQRVKHIAKLATGPYEAVKFRKIFDRLFYTHIGEINRCQGVDNRDY
jgi:hypothetical protein